MGHSPMQKKKTEAVGLRLGQVLEYVRAGWSVRRRIWPEGCHVRMVEGRLSVALEDGKYRHWIISEEDLRAEDWETVK